MEAYGAARWNMMHPNRSAIEMGIPVAGNSDGPVSEPHPMLRIQSMVTRESAEGKVYGEKQCVTVDQAIKIWTLGSAYASFEEETKGSITPGKLADFVVLGRDPREIDTHELQSILVEKTFVGGKLVYDRHRLQGGQPRSLIDFGDHESIDSHRPIIIAHRGGVVSPGSPECSLTAIRLAAAMDYDMVELDIQSSSDGVPIVFHDRDLSRVCDKDGRVADFTATELEAISYVVGNDRIVRLNTALQLCRRLGARCDQMFRV
jgi:hypothetical protein